MKLTKGTKEISLTDPETEKKGGWADEIVSQFGKDIPVMTNIPKRTGSADIRFIGLGRLVELANNLIPISVRFKNLSQVYRAAMYIGMHVLYHLVKEGNGNDKALAGNTIKVFSTMEKCRFQSDLIDMAIEQANELLRSMKNEILSVEEVEAKFSSLVDAMPNELKTPLRSKLGQLKDGKSVTSLFEHKAHGGHSSGGEGKKHVG